MKINKTVKINWKKLLEDKKYNSREPVNMRDSKSSEKELPTNPNKPLALPTQIPLTLIEY